ncbi:hypothetical protein BDV95DRAFT_606142 [Massariosphaeria phaeospora]|uniref:MHYT domain-containing protein n=1 Tax=Massariosphaeria phaeospora TaxID=100035 RepID=A0A7C8M784_9PLEO|nr:hypothetical protein BDV95DRAFT_606142 [Massariosphaeria phaeospora]
MEADLAIKYPLGSRPHVHYLPHDIFVSYIVSLIGAFTTVELLHRRVSGAGWRSWVQLAASAVSFGLVAIWCMHFVGNRAIRLGDGEEEIQLYYDSAFTAISAILPIVVILLGFSIADRFYKSSRGSTTRYMALTVCGVCAGAAVTGMHYLGNQGTTNYRLIPTWPFVIGASLIAVGACCISLGLFFHWSGHWMNNIWRRLVVACFLAVAVSGMHWTAAAGTTYELIGYHKGPGRARAVNLIIALCLSVGACGACFALGFLKQRHRRQLRDRAQQVVLAVATFDKEGRLLVDQGGLLPCQTITTRFHQRTFDEEFNTSHSVFQWLFRVSRHWSGIVDLIPSMRDHLQATGYLQSQSASANESRASFGSEDNSGYSVIFRELFCVTALDLARSLHTRLQDLGYLYEEVLTTGTASNNIIWKDTARNKNIIAADAAISHKDAMRNSVFFGRGQLLILTRKIDTEESNRLQNIGYRFANLDQVGENLASSLQVSRDDLGGLVARLQLFCGREAWVPANGTYLAAFVLQPLPVMKGLNVIVSKSTPDRLPMVKLDSQELSQQHLDFLATLHGLTLDDCLVRIVQESSSLTNGDIWLETFRNKIHELLNELPESALRRSTFSAQQLDITNGVTGKNQKIRATAFAFCGIKEVYHQSLASPSLTCVPLSFFQTFLRSYPGCPDHAILAQKNYREFSNLFVPSSNDVKASSGSSRGAWHSFWRPNKSLSLSETSLNPDSSSEKGLVSVAPLSRMESANNVAHPFGGIMVSQDVVINADKKSSCQIELKSLGLRTEAGVADREQQTMADILMSITTSFRDPHNMVPREGRW